MGTAPSIPRKARQAPRGLQSLHALVVDTYGECSILRLLFPAGHKAPDRAHDRAMNFPCKIEHPHKPLERLLAFMIVVAESYTQLIGDRPLLDAPDKNVAILFLKKAGKLQRVGVIDYDGSLVGDLVQVPVIFLGTRLGPHHNDLHSEQTKGLDQ